MAHKKVDKNHTKSVNADTSGQMGILIILLYHTKVHANMNKKYN